MQIQMPGFNQGFQSNSMGMGTGPGTGFQMLQQLVQLLMTIMMSQMGGDNGMMGGNPQFGNRGGCGCSGPSQFGSGSGVPGYQGFNGQSNSSPSGLNDHYVPPGISQGQAVGDLGQGSGADAVRWALGKEGISESNNPAAVRAISRGAWQPWCADFVSQAYANSPGGSPFGHQSSVAGILAWGRDNERFFGAGAAQSNPGMLKPGDIAVWKSNGRSHVGLITGVNENGTFNTIEGNTGNAVRRRTHGFDAGLTGFVRPRG